MTAPLTLAQAHVVKCWPEFFAAVIDGRKRFEIRRNDRNYQTGDSITLREWEPGTSRYSGREASFTIGYITQFDQREGYVVFALLPAVPQPCSHPSVDDGECNLCDQPVPQEPQAQERKQPVEDTLHAVFTRHGIASRADLPHALISDLIGWAAMECRHATKSEPAPSPLSAEALERIVRDIYGQVGFDWVQHGEAVTRLLTNALSTAPAPAQRWQQEREALDIILNDVPCDTYQAERTQNGFVECRYCGQSEQTHALIKAAYALLAKLPTPPSAPTGEKR